VSEGALSQKGVGHARTRSIRLVRRAGGGRLPFAPYGLFPVIALGLLLLFALTFFPRGAVEDIAMRTTRQALNSVGATWASASVSGQWVTLEGAPPSRAEAAKAVAAVQNAKAATVFGAAIPVTRVAEHFVWEGENARMAAEPRPAPETKTADMVSPTAAAACDRSMSTLLGTARIEFASSSAEISPGSEDLLDAIARAASWCPGLLRIEGHTDSSGGAALNDKLSRSRAEAVRAALVRRGVPEERLTAEGLGSSRPLASNRTADGRERNRRIEMRVVQTQNEPSPT
jgi:outer membrane protein OmpA-like peptidoglycan-associated protein